MDERRPLTREQQRIRVWAEKRGMEPPPAGEPVPDSDGFIRSTVLKAGLGGAVTEDDRALIAAMTTTSPKQPHPYSVKSSKDGLYWEFSIHIDSYRANLAAQHRLGIEQTRPHKFEVVSPGEEGYFDEPSTFEPRVPVTVDKVLKPGPDSAAAYRETVAIADSQGDII